MSYSTRNGKLEKTMPEAPKTVLVFHVLTKMKVEVDPKTGQLMTAHVEHAKVSTKPEDGLSEKQITQVMENRDKLIELAGVLLVKHVQQKAQPLVQLAKPGTPA